MKKICLICLAIGATAALNAQDAPSQVTPMNDASDAVMEVFRSAEWRKSFVGGYGIDSDIEPELKDADREILGQVVNLIQTGNRADLESALRIIEGHVMALQTQQQEPGARLYYIAGVISYQLAAEARGSQRRQVQEKARSYFLNAVDPQKGFPRYRSAHTNLANLAFQMEDLGLAQKHFVRAIQLGESDAKSYGLLGAIYFQDNKLVSAEAAIRQALLMDPSIIEFKQILGQVLFMQERYNEAKELFGELIQLRPDKIEYWLMQSNAYINLDLIDEAAKNLEVVRFMGRADAPSLMLLGHVYMNKEMIDEASEAYMDAVRLNPKPDQLNTYLQAAETLNSFTAYTQSLALIDTIERAYGDSFDSDQRIEVLTLRSEINIAMGEGERAAGNLENILKMDPFNERALLSLGRFYSEREPDDSLPDDEYDFQKRRYEQTAINYFERAQSLEDPDAQRRAFIGEAQLRVQRQELERAADLLQQAQDIDFQDNIQSYLDQIRDAIKARAAR